MIICEVNLHEMDTALAQHPLFSFTQESTVLCWNTQQRAIASGTLKIWQKYAKYHQMPMPELKETNQNVGIVGATNESGHQLDPDVRKEHKYVVEVEKDLVARVLEWYPRFHLSCPVTTADQRSPWVPVAVHYSAWDLYCLWEKQLVSPIGLPPFAQDGSAITSVNADLLLPFLRASFQAA